MYIDMNWPDAVPDWMKLMPMAPCALMAIAGIGVVHAGTAADVALLHEGWSAAADVDFIPADIVLVPGGIRDDLIGYNKAVRLVCIHDARICRDRDGSAVRLERRHILVIRIHVQGVGGKDRSVGEDIGLFQHIERVGAVRRDGFSAQSIGFHEPHRVARLCIRHGHWTRQKRVNVRLEEGRTQCQRSAISEGALRKSIHQRMNRHTRITKAVKGDEQGVGVVAEVAGIILDGNTRLACIDLIKIPACGSQRRRVVVLGDGENEKVPGVGFIGVKIADDEASIAGQRIVGTESVSQERVGHLR